MWSHKTLSTLINVIAYGLGAPRTRTNVDLSSMEYFGIHLNVIFFRVVQHNNHRITLENCTREISVCWSRCLSGANELNRTSLECLIRRLFCQNIFGYITTFIDMQTYIYMEYFDSSEYCVYHNSQFEKQLLCGNGISPLITFPQILSIFSGFSHWNILIWQYMNR